MTKTTHSNPSSSVRRALLCGSAMGCALLALGAPAAAAPLTQDIGTRSSSTDDTPAYSITHNDTLTLTGDSVTTTGARSTGLVVSAPQTNITIDEIGTTGDRSAGMRFTGGTGDSSATIGRLTTTGYQADGLYVRMTGAGGFTLDLGEGASGPASDVADIATKTGAINITAGTIRSGGGGFSLETTTGAITVSIDDLINTGSQHGVSAYSESGAIDITVGNARAQGANGSAVVAKTIAGDISIKADETFHAGYQGAAISAETMTGDINIESDAIVTQGLEDAGIQIEAGAGEVSVTSGSITTAGERTIGIHVITYGTDPAAPGAGVTIESGSITSTGNSTTGMRVYTTNEEALIDSGTIAMSGDNSAALTLFSETGQIHLVSGSIVMEGDSGRAVLASNISGDIIVESQTVTTSGEGTDGFWLMNETGAISLTTDSITTTGAEATAITIATGGDVTVDSNTLSTADGDGMMIEAGGDITVDSEQLTVAGVARTGIQLVSETGDIALNAGATTVTGAEVIGIGVWNQDGAVVIDSDTLAVNGEAGEGSASHAALYASTLSGDITVTSGSVDADGARRSGVVAESGSGDITLDLTRVDASGVNANAVFADTGGAVTARFRDLISSQQGVAVDLTGATINITLDEEARVMGAEGGLLLESGAGGATVQNNGTIMTTSGFAIAAVGGPATVRNAGQLFGRLSLTGGADRMFNTGHWQIIGTSEFGAGDDLIENTGTLAVQLGGASQTVTFNALERFNNAGVIDLGQDRAGDRLVLPDAVFNGQAGGILRVAVNFQNGVSDQLVIASATGVTPIHVDPIGEVQLGSTFDIVDSEAALTGSEFVMADDNPESLVGFDLVVADGGIVRLSAAPNQNAFAPLKVGAAGQRAWSKTSEVWSTRMSVLREGESLAASRDGARWWAQAYGGEERLGQSGLYQMTGGPVTRDLTTETSWFGFQGGVDGGFGVGGATAAWGLTAGYGDLRLDFVSEDNIVSLTGFNVGAYGGVQAGPFFADLLVKVDSFEATADLRTAGEKEDFDGVSYGVQGEVGARFDVGAWTVEPSVSAAWVKTDIDALAIGAATIGFDDAVSLEGRAGLRVSAPVTVGGLDMRAFLGGQVIHEFEGDNEMNFTAGGTTVRIKDRPTDTYGRVDFGAVGQLGAGLRGFVRGEANVGSDVQGFTARFGASWSW